MKDENLVIITGSVTIKPIYSPGQGFIGSCDFEMSNRSGRYQVVAINRDIVKSRDLIKGRIRVIGKLSNRGGDGIIMADRVEFA